ncbi:MAG: hypothetical protein AAGA48_35270 [Myxococcota bacterium]
MAFLTKVGGLFLWAMGLGGCVKAEPIEERTTDPLDFLPVEVEDRLERFVAGVNLPWLRYGHDFGRAWGNRGIRTPDSREQLEADFDALVGVEVVRWFLFADGRALGQSTPDEVLADFDAALEVADARGIQLMPVLFDFYWFDQAKIVNDVQLFGRREMALDPVLRRDLIETWIVPLQRYDHDPRIFAFDLINEPEWALLDGLHAPLVADPVTLQEMWDFLFDVALPLRGGRPLTVGSASAEDLAAIWLDAPLDLLQVHHYDVGELPLVDEYPTDLPILVGEFPTDPLDLQIRLETYEALGYAGAMPWSFNAKDEAADRAALVDHFSEEERSPRLPARGPGLHSTPQAY